MQGPPERRFFWPNLRFLQIADRLVLEALRNVTTPVSSLPRSEETLSTNEPGDPDATH